MKIPSLAEPAHPKNASISKPILTTYHLVAGESIPDGIRRIITEQIDQAVWQLTDPPDGRDKGVHNARKCFKKIRAVLRLVRNELGEPIFKCEDICYRDAGRLLAPVRESAVLVITVDRVCERFADQLAPGTFSGLRHKLEARHHAVCEQILEQESHVEKVMETLHLARQRAVDLPIANDDFSALYSGLRRVYRRGYKQIHNVYAAPSAEGFHEWRKQIKHLWYHLRILIPIWESQLVVLSNDLNDAADWLGDNHDLAELRLLVLEHPEWFPDPAALQFLLAQIDCWRLELELNAQPVGRRIYVEKPRAFINRMASYWQIWQAETGNV